MRLICFACPLPILLSVMMLAQQGAHSRSGAQIPVARHIQSMASPNLSGAPQGPRFRARGVTGFRAAALLPQFPQLTGSFFESAGLFDSGGQQAYSVTVGDVNGDGKPDLLVSNLCAVDDFDCSNGGIVGVLLGNGDGTFQPVVTYSSGGDSATSLAIGDVNGDGKPDLLVANACAASSCANGSIGVLLGNGDGTFQTAVTFSTGGYNSASLTLGDVNGDGKPDLLVANQCATNSGFCPGTVSVLLGNGNGTFQLPVTYSSGGYDGASVVLGDVNGDGKPDLLVVNQCATNSDFFCFGSVGVLLGNGDGTFQTSVAYGSGGQTARSVILGDVNGDGKSDLIVINDCATSCENGGLGVLLGNGDGSFQTAIPYSSGGQSPRSVVVGDVNLDGAPDLIVANLCALGDGSCSNGGVVSVLLNNGSGAFLSTTSYASGGPNANSVALGDVNGDGKLDLLVANNCVDSENCSGVLGMLPGNGDGTFNAAVVYGSGGSEAAALTVGDVNGDGVPDLLIAAQCASATSCDSAAVNVLLGNGDGTFQPPVAYGSGGSDARSVVIADVNGDGKPDLVVANQSGAAGVLLGNGDGTYQAAVTYNSGGNNVTSLAITDVNGDGKPDLVLANECAASDCTSASVSVLLGNGDGTFQSAVNYSSGGYFATSVVVGDFNGDGKPDLLVANECAVGSNCASTGSLGVLLGNGDGTFRTAVNYGPGGQFPYSLAVGDVNGDGTPDLLVVNQCADSVCANGTLGVLLGKGDGTFKTAVPAMILPQSFAALAVADFNGDGKLDVASAGFLLTGNGDGTFQGPVDLGASGGGIAVGDFNLDGRPDLAIGGVAVLLNVNSQGLKTTVSLTSSSNPSYFGQSVTFTALAPAHGGFSPGGAIVFRNGETILGTVVLTSRHASMSTLALSGGSQSITASYSGDLHFSAITSAPLSQLVNQVASTISLTASMSPISLNQPVTYTANIASQYGGNTTGTVTFKDRSKTIAVVAVAAGQASYSISYSAAGTHLITAVYSGDASNSGSTSPVLNAYVEAGPVASKTVITTSGSPSLVGQSVTFTATITSSYGSIPDGDTVIFYDGTVVIGSSATVGGSATISTSALVAKTHAIKASYQGDASFKPSLGLVQQVVLDFVTSLIVGASPSPSAFGQPVLLTTTVTSNAPGGATGTVTFKNGTAVLGTASLSGGTATLTTTRLAAGTAAITASYNGDLHSAKSAEAFTESVHPAVSSSSLASSMNPSPAGRIVRLTAQVNSPTTLVTGSVTFKDGATTLATVNLAGGKATYSTAVLSSGSHNITAEYNGTANILDSISPSVVQTVR
jgi:hypothetical protein